MYWIEISIEFSECGARSRSSVMVPDVLVPVRVSIIVPAFISKLIGSRILQVTYSSVSIQPLCKKGPVFTFCDLTVKSHLGYFRSAILCNICLVIGAE